MNTDNGGPAFPSNGWDETGQFPAHFFGMELRDYFAAKAMQSIMSNSGGYWESENIKQYALIAYEQADAMLKARAS